jgi:site-specific DNA-methyltransferase (cytosine-N4-specific)
MIPTAASLPPASAEPPEPHLYTGDAAPTLATLPAASIDCVVTSPPYWRLRDHRTAQITAGRVPADAPIGMEPTLEAYLDRLRTVFTELARVLRPTGTVWLLLGDSYAANSDGYQRTRAAHPRQPTFRPDAGLAAKNLIGLPWRTALTLQADGWILRNAIAWAKPSPTPWPARDRLASTHEWIFLLVRQPRYHFDLDPLRVPYSGDRPLSRRAHRGGKRPHGAAAPRADWPPPSSPAAAPPGRNPGDVWTIPTRPSPRGGPPAFPLELPLRCIAAGCPPGGTVLDPFSGSGTTGLAAHQLGRSYTGIDISAPHTALAHDRLTQHGARPMIIRGEMRPERPSSAPAGFGPHARLGPPPSCSPRGPVPPSARRDGP